MTGIVEISVSLKQAPALDNFQQRGLILARNTECNIAAGSIAVVSSKDDKTSIAATGDLAAKIDVWFANTKANIPVSVLSISDTSEGTEIATFKTWLQANPLKYYAYAVPKDWNDETTFATLANGYTGNSARQYFFVNVPDGNYTLLKGKKSVVGYMSPSGSDAQFGEVALMAQTLDMSPSPLNKMLQLQHRFVSGVTANPGSQATEANKTAWKADFMNHFVTGKKAGLSESVMVSGGTTADGRDISYWYAIDWSIYQSSVQLANEVVNGANDPVTTLHYEQSGIDRLRNRVVATLESGVEFGVIKSDFTVSAIPYKVYLKTSASDVAKRAYKGLSAEVTPQGGFGSVVFHITVTDF